MGSLVFALRSRRWTEDVLVGLPNLGRGGEFAGPKFRIWRFLPCPLLLLTLPHLAPSPLVLTPIPPPWHVILLLLMDCQRGGFGPPAVTATGAHDASFKPSCWINPAVVLQLRNTA